jgi:hypothetical protein
MAENMDSPGPEGTLTIAHSGFLFKIHVQISKVKKLLFISTIQPTTNSGQDRFALFLLLLLLLFLGRTD